MNDGQDGADGRWLSYRELAQARGITTDSATRLAFRRKWRRQVGNDGTARVLVPPAEAAPAKSAAPYARDDIAPDAAHDGIPDATPDAIPDITRTVNALEGALASLREQLDRERARCDAAEERAGAARMEAEAAATRAAAAEARLNVVEAALAEARTPWPIRVVRALRPRTG